MSVLQRILLGLVVLVFLVVLVGFFLPASAHVERSTTIDAPPATIFALVNGFRSFNNWSPWAERDPQAEYLYEGPDSGVGATMRWASQNPQVGSGFQKITASEPYKRIQTHLDFGSQGTAQAFFDLQPTAAGTAVTWGFDTDFGMNLVSRYMGLMFDNWVGADYEAGLANLEILAEGLEATLIDRGNAGLIAQLCMRYHERSVGWFRRLPLGDPLFARMENILPATLRHEPVQQPLYLFFKNCLEPFSFQNHPVIIETWQ